MRLTLRTMLCYLDDLLEPEDAQELSKKIEESEFATSLVHRIRGSMRRLRLGAPAVSGSGSGLDANTVAEYLDNTLPPERVPDFEKVSLDSEVHLAEVASCHQILSWVLNEPAQVEPGLRSRIYRMEETHSGDLRGMTDEAAALSGRRPASDNAASGARAAAGAAAVSSQTAPAGTNTGGTTAADVPEATGPAEGEPLESGEMNSAVATPPVQAGAAVTPPPALDDPRPKTRQPVPDYVKAGRRSPWVPLVVTVVLAFLLAAVGILAIGPQRVASLFDGSPTAKKEAPADDQPAAPAAPPAQPGEKPGPAADPESPDAKTPPVDPDSPKKPASDGELRQPIKRPMVDDEGEDPPLPPPTPLPEDRLPEDEKPGDKPADDKSSDGSPAGDGPSEKPGVDPDKSVAAVKKPEPPVPPEGSPEKPADAEPGDGGKEPPPIAAQVQEVARFTTEGEVLVRYDPSAKVYGRVPPRSLLKIGDRLVALPTYRCGVSMLGTTVELLLDGGTQIRLPAPREEAMPRIHVDFGRLVVMAGKPGAAVSIEFGTRQGTVRMADIDSTLVIEMVHVRKAGTDPRDTDATPTVRLIAAGGGLSWEDVSGRQDIDAGGVLLLEGEKPIVRSTMAEKPAWVDAKQLEPIDRRASEFLAPLVDLKRPATISLAELSEERRVEVRSLAARSLALLDRYDSSIAALNDPELKAYWDDQFDALQQAVARSRDAAKAVHAAMQKVRGEEADALFRMLWGYTNEQLADGQDKVLVEALSHESLDFRVLASENLRRISGGRITYLYRPEFPEKRRRQAVARWQERLEEDKIRHGKPSVLDQP